MGRFSGRKIGSQETCLDRVSRICFRGKAVEQCTVSCQMKNRNTDIRYGILLYTYRIRLIQSVASAPDFPMKAGVSCFITEGFGEACKPKHVIKKYEQSFFLSAALLVLFTSTSRCLPFHTLHKSCFWTDRASSHSGCHKCLDASRLRHHHFTLTHQSDGTE